MLTALSDWQHSSSRLLLLSVEKPFPSLVSTFILSYRTTLTSQRIHRLSRTVEEVINESDSQPVEFHFKARS